MKLKINNHDWALAYKIESNFRYIISEQESYGWFMDKEEMDNVECDLKALVVVSYTKIREQAPKRILDEKEIKKPLKKDGTLSQAVLNWYNRLDVRMFLPEDIWGPFTRIKVELINPESPKQRIEALQKIGWKPTEYNYKKDKYKKPIYDECGEKVPLSPKLTEDSVVGIPLGEEMVKYVQVSHRLKLVKGLKERLREDGSIGGGGNTVGCNTGRMMHRNIVNIPSIKEGAFYAEEIRSMFSHREGTILLGADLSTLEARLAGHYTYNIDGGVYAKDLMTRCEHERTAEVLNVTRSQGKTINYAMMFGCSFHKLKELLNCTDLEAKQKHKAWWLDRKPLLELKDKLLQAVETRTPMWIKGLDGRKVYCRSKHSLLNALIQSAGSVVNKFITCCIYKRIKETGISANLVLNYHDEVDYEIYDDKKTLDTMKNIVYNSVEECNKYFKFKVPMEMNIKTGRNWSDIH